MKCLNKIYKTIYNIKDIDSVFSRCFGKIFKRHIFKLKITFIFKDIDRNQKHIYCRKGMINGHRDIDNIAKKFIDKIAEATGFNDCRIVDLHLLKLIGNKNKIIIEIERI